MHGSLAAGGPAARAAGAGAAGVQALPRGSGFILPRFSSVGANGLTCAYSESLADGQTSQGIGVAPRQRRRNRSPPPWRPSPTLPTRRKTMKGERSSPNGWRGSSATSMEGTTGLFFAEEFVRAKELHEGVCPPSKRGGAPLQEGRQQEQRCHRGELRQRRAPFVAL